jgi:hypothetical protein
MAEPVSFNDLPALVQHLRLAWRPYRAWMLCEPYPGRRYACPGLYKFRPLGAMMHYRVRVYPTLFYALRSLGARAMLRWVQLYKFRPLGTRMHYRVRVYPTLFYVFRSLGSMLRWVQLYKFRATMHYRVRVYPTLSYVLRWG